NDVAGAASRCSDPDSDPAGLAKPTLTSPASEPAWASSPGVPSVLVNASRPSLLGSLTVAMKWADIDNVELAARLTPSTPTAALTTAVSWNCARASTVSEGVRAALSTTTYTVLLAWSQTALNVMAALTVSWTPPVEE